MARKQKKRSSAQVAADRLRTGRPRIGKKPRERTAAIRVTGNEYEKLVAAARRSGLSLTDYLRRKVGLK